MAHLSILISGIDTGTGALQIDGQAITSDMSSSDSAIPFSVTVGYGELATTINAAIREAAIDAVELEGHTVGALDKKTLYAGAMGL